MNRENLKKLADYLLSGNLKADFDMSDYSSERHHYRGGSPTDCGTVGCAVGHGPHSGIKKYKSESWAEYAERGFGLSLIDDEWHWCFADEWVFTDNTPEGAGKRINWLLEKGLPRDWKEQMNGKAKLCYL